MSRTYRNNNIVRERSAFGTLVMNWDKGQWRRTAPEPRGNSKPFKDRHVTPEGKLQMRRCRCHDYCVPGRLHKNHRRGFPYSLGTEAATIYQWS